MKVKVINNKIMKLIKRTELSVSDIFQVEECIMKCYSKFELIYKQDENQLCRFPELLELFEDGVFIEKGKGWGFFRFVSNGSKIDNKKVALSCYNAFSECKNIAVVFNGERIEVTSNAKYKNESFEIYRNRSLFEIRDYLGIDHNGKGKDSIRM